MKTVIFARVSTNIQEYDRQVNELTTLANSKGWSVEAVFAEKISGAKANAERIELLKELQELLSAMPEYKTKNGESLLGFLRFSSETRD